MNKSTLGLGISISLLTVVIGAFGAHGLKSILLENETLDVFETAVNYQGMHAIALIFTGILSANFNRKLLNWAKYCFFSGVIFFSGSLYVLSISGVKVFGAITPFGGVLFILGWSFLLLAIYKKRDSNH